MKKIEVK